MHWRKIFSNKSDSTDIVMRKIENRRLNYMYNMLRLSIIYFVMYYISRKCCYILVKIIKIA